MTDNAITGVSLPTSQVNQLLKAYQTGVMKPEDAAQFENDVHSGLIILPSTVHIGGKPQAEDNNTVTELPKPVIDAYNKAAANPYDKGVMDEVSRKQLDADLAAGLIKLPTGAALNQSYLGVTGKVKEAVTGELRSTEATKNNQDYSYLPEMGHISWPAFKTAMGTMVTSDPNQIAKIIKTQFPKVEVSQDEKGNYLFKSGEDGKTYALRPGATLDDLAKGAGMFLAYTPAGRAETVVGATIANAGTQAGLEGVKTATGGDFDPSAVATAGVIGGAIPLAGKAYNAAVPLAKSIVGREAAAGTENLADAAPKAPEAPIPSAADFTVDGAGNTTPKAPIESKAETAMPQQGGAEIHYQTAENTVVKQGGSLSWRNNNPGNIRAGEFANKHGAISNNKGFAVFPDEATGNAAREALLFESPKYKDLSIGRAILRYAPPVENDTGAYINTVTKSAGLNPGRVLSSLSKDERARLLTAMKSHEGWKPGKTTIGGVEQPVEAVAATPKIATPKEAPNLMPSNELGQTARTAALEGIGSTNAKKVLAEQAAPSPKMLEAAKRLGIEDNLQADHVSTNQAYRELTQVIKSLPGSALHAQETQGLANVAKRADELINELGGAKDLSTVSTGVKESLSKTQQQLEGQANQAYKVLKATIPNTASVEANDVLGFINQRAVELGGVENLSPIERTIYRKLTPKEVNAKAPTVEEGAVLTSEEYNKLQASIDAVKNGAKDLKQPTYALLDDVRRSVGDALFKKAGPFKDAQSGLLKKLYSSLTNDQGTVAEAHGVKDLWNKAKSLVEVRKGVEDDLTALFGKQLDKSIANDIATSISKADGAAIAKFLSHVPKELRQEVVASGLIGAFQKGSRSGTMNFNGYARWYEKLLSNKQAYHAIMSNLPSEARKQLSDLYRVANGISLSTKEFLRTGKLGPGVDVIKESMKQPDNLVSKLYEAAGHLGRHAGKAAFADVLGGHGMGAATAAISALRSSGKTDAIKAVDALLASPEFEAAAKQIVKGEKEKGASALAYSKPFLKFTRALNNPRELTNKERWIIQALEANNNNNSQ